MIAVLIDSRKRGASGRVAVRDAQKLRVSGLIGADVVRVLFFNGDEAPIEALFKEDMEVALIPCHSVSAEHVECGTGRVFVDLER